MSERSQGVGDKTVRSSLWLYGRLIMQSVRAQLEELSGDAIVNDLYFTAYYVK